MMCLLSLVLFRWRTWRITLIIHHQNELRWREILRLVWKNQLAVGRRGREEIQMTIIFIEVYIRFIIIWHTCLSRLLDANGLLEEDAPNLGR